MVCQHILLWQQKDNLTELIAWLFFHTDKKQESNLRRTLLPISQVLRNLGYSLNAVLVKIVLSDLYLVIVVLCQN